VTKRTCETCRYNVGEGLACVVGDYYTKNVICYNGELWEEKKAVEELRAELYDVRTALGGYKEALEESVRIINLIRGAVGEQCVEPSYFLPYYCREDKNIEED